MAFFWSRPSRGYSTAGLLGYRPAGSRALELKLQGFNLHSVCFQGELAAKAFEPLAGGLGKRFSLEIKAVNQGEELRIGRPTAVGVQIRMALLLWQRHLPRLCSGHGASATRGARWKQADRKLSSLKSGRTFGFKALGGRVSEYHPGHAVK